MRIADKPFCKPGQVQVYGVAKHERIQVACEVIANPSVNEQGGPRGGRGSGGLVRQNQAGLTFDWVFNSSSERIDLPSNKVKVSGTRSLAEYMPKVFYVLDFTNGGLA